MNVVEREAARPQAVADKSAEASTAAPVPSARAVKLRPLLVARPLHRTLSLAGRLRRCVRCWSPPLATLLVPIAVRRMIDFGFSRDSADPDRQLFRRHDRASWRCSRSRAPPATTSSPRWASASSPTCAATCFATSDVALARLFRSGQDRRVALAADRRHHADQGGGRRLGLDRACAMSCCSSAPPP